MGEKRVRTNRRFEAGYVLAVVSCAEGWPEAQRQRAIEEALAKNEDLVKGNAIQQARREWQRWSDPQLCGWHTRLRDYAQRIKDAEPAGSTARLNHIFDQLCKDVLAHPHGVEAALQALGETMPHQHAVPA